MNGCKPNAYIRDFTVSIIITTACILDLSYKSSMLIDRKYATFPVDKIIVAHLTFVMNRTAFVKHEQVIPYPYSLC